MNRINQFEIIQEEINRWDPIGLLKIGAPLDEYIMEITKISSYLKSMLSVEELAEIIYQIFNDSFNHNVFQKSYFDCYSVAQKIFNRIK